MDSVNYKVSVLEKELSALTGKTVKLTVHMVHQNFVPPEEFVLRVKEIVRKNTNVGEKDLESNSRERQLVDSRSICFSLIKKFAPVYSFGLSLKKIGSHFGGRDHTTVIHNLETFESLYMTEPRFKQLADRCADELKQEFEKEREEINEPA